MTNNPIVDEIHQIREKMLAEHGGDLHAFARDMQRKTEEARAAGATVVSLQPRRPVAEYPPKPLAAP